MALIFGTNSSDTITGTNGDDIIFGENGNDSIDGGKGNDVITGGAGDDVLTGGAGNDVFRYDAREFGSDTITDFSSGDKLDLRALNVSSISDLAPFLSQSGSDTVLSFVYGGWNEIITLKNVTLSSLTSSSFMFNTSSNALDVSGTDSNDVLFGGKGADHLYGNGGNDTIVAGAGHDVIDGGTGNDALYGGAGGDVFTFSGREFGTDTIMDFASGDKIDLRGYGVESLSDITPYMSQSGSDVVIATQYGGWNENIVIKNATLASVTAADFIFNTSKDPLIVSGTNSNDTLFGGKAADFLYGNAGNDALNGGAGHDVLDGGTGNDMLYGGAGSDTFTFSSREFGTNTIMDFASGDKVDLRGYGVDSLTDIAPYMSQSGSDVVIATQHGGWNENIVIKNTTLAGIGSSDFLFNTSSETQIEYGTNSNDTLFGGKGADHLYGNAGNDGLNGGAGNDLIDGGTGNDMLYGNAGNDTFTFSSREFGTNTIMDFASGDKIDVSGYGVADLADLTPFMNQVGSDVTIATDYGGWNEQIVVKNETIAALTASSFVFDTASDTIVQQGTNSNDTLFGGNGNDYLIGYGGADDLTGGPGADTFVYYGVSDSYGTSYDTLHGLNFAQDFIDLPFAVSAIDAEVHGGTLNANNFNNDLAADIGTAQLGANHAVLFAPNAGTYAGDLLLIVDGNSTAGYQSGHDMVFLLDGANHLSSISTGDFI